MLMHGVFEFLVIFLHMLFVFLLVKLVLVFGELSPIQERSALAASAVACLLSGSPAPLACSARKEELDGKNTHNEQRVKRMLRTIFGGSWMVFRPFASGTGQWRHWRSLTRDGVATFWAGF